MSFVLLSIPRQDELVRKCNSYTVLVHPNLSVYIQQDQWTILMLIEESEEVTNPRITLCTVTSTPRYRLQEVHLVNLSPPLTTHRFEIRRGR